MRNDQKRRAAPASDEAMMWVMVLTCCFVMV